MHRAGWLLLFVSAIGGWNSAANAQGVVLRLPEDGTWVRYEGTFGQTEIRPNTATGKLEIPPWLEHVTIKSVGTEDAEFQGETVKCRWIEIKIERGREADGKIDTGTTGLEIYKVLVPEPAVTADPKSADGVPASFSPVVKGFRQIGKGEPRKLEVGAMKLYPLAVVLGYCRDFTVTEQGVDPEIGIADVKADVLAGTTVIERPSSKTELESKVWTSPQVPFGVAAWTAKITRSIKDDQEARDDFKPLTEITVAMKARESGTNAQSEVNP
ncbi:MAG TPA: hypothetical protein VFG20_04170 [Planctomycetaceae bacterium]|nr:hypothetical protein [Planctomycetaceae bacterium]